VIGRRLYARVRTPKGCSRCYCHHHLGAVARNKLLAGYVKLPCWHSGGFTDILLCKTLISFSIVLRSDTGGSGQSRADVAA